MATEVDLALFLEELETVRRLPEASRWSIERDNSVPIGIFVVMHPRSAPNELYKARLRWTDYFEPVSLKFINMSTGADTDCTAWPRCPGFRPESQDACLSWTGEGHGLHPDWKASAQHKYQPGDAPMQFALLQLQHLLDSSYQGRGG